MRSKLKTATSSVILSIVLFATAQLSVGSTAKSGPHRHWSIDLTNYWPLKAPQGGSAPYTDAYLAADNSSVGVALESGDPTHGPWKSSLLVFDSDTGKLRQECGPWDGRMIAGFSATASGNFLETWEPFPGARNGAANLSLLSPSCAELQNLPLSAAKGSGQSGWNVLLSPSRRTLLTADTTARATKFMVRDADTFAVHFEWQEPESDEMRVVSVSDAGVLALKSKKPSDVGFGPVVRLGQVFPPLPLAIAPDGTWFAAEKGNILSVRP